MEKTSPRIANYVIAIGGTGSKICEALIHLSAIGVVPGSRMTAVFIDQDKSNGNLDRADQLLETYIECSRLGFAGGDQIFPVDQHKTNPHVWAPATQNNATLSGLIGYNDIGPEDECIKKLFDVIFTDNDRKENLNKGFLGYPSIGAVAFLRTVDFKTEEPWIRFIEDIRRDASAGLTVNIILAGSIFGGTGASGFPTIASLIRAEIENQGIITDRIRLGGVLALPYFSFPPNTQASKNTLYANSEFFLIKSKVALQYYQKNNMLGEIFDSIYMIGNDELALASKNEPGAQAQKNNAHFIELLGALAARDFFQKASEPEEHDRVYVMARKRDKVITLDDIARNDPEFQKRFISFVRMCYLFLGYYKHILLDSTSRYYKINIPLLTTFFKGEVSPDDKSKAQCLERYFTMFLTWLGQLHSFSKPKLDLVKWDLFASADNEGRVSLRNNFDLNGFNKLAIAHGRTVKGIWHKVNSMQGNGMQDFIQALYKACTVTAVTSDVSGESIESYYPFLPKQKRDSAVTVFERYGVWLSRDKEEIDRIKDGIEEHLEKNGQVTLNPSLTEVFSCIPDLWARALLFEMALFDSNHMYHGLVVGEWRGLLAMIALRRRLNLTQFISQPITIGSGDRRYETVLRRSMHHTRSLSADTTWGDIYALIYGRFPIGITTPTTLVCTAASYESYIDPATVKWFNGIRLRDPIPCLSNYDLVDLYGWVKDLKERLYGYPGRNEEIGDDISKALSDFIEDLDDAIARKGLAHSANNTYVLQSLRMNRGVFRSLDYCLGDVDIASDVELISDPSNLHPKWLIVDKNIAVQWKKQPNQVHVVDSFTLDNAETVIRDKAKYKRQGKEIKESKDIFMPKLILLRQSLPGMQMVRGADTLIHRDKPATPLLPVVKELVEYVGYEAFMESVSYAQIPTGISVTIDLKLRAGEIRLVKDYTLQEQVMIREIPQIDIWPYFKRAGWKSYYLCESYYTDPRDSMHLINVGSTANRDITKDNKVTRVHIYQLNSFPELLECETDRANKENHAIGLIPVKQPPVRNVIPDSDWQVSIDVGTVNTNIFIRNGAKIEPFVFNSQLVFPLSDTGANRDVTLYLEFIPPVNETVPFQSVFHTFDATVLAKEPLLDGRVFFIGDDTAIRFGKLDQDLKWAQKVQDREKLRIFISQIVYHILADAANNGIQKVSWRYAYPSAFNDYDLNKYSSYWDTILDKASIEACTGITVMQATPNTESMAAAKFFEMTQSGMVCLDIGGGTTDISIWQEGKPICQASILFAGREIFEPNLFRFSVIGEILKNSAEKGEIDNLLAQIQERDFSGVPITLYKLLKKHENKVFRDLPIFSDTEEFRKLYYRLMLGVAGIVYYSALILKHLLSDNRYSKGYCGIYFAGNGSKILKWLEPKDTSLNILEGLVSSVTGLVPEEFSIITSERPKSEVAIGLLNDTNISEQKTSRILPMGEPFIRAQNGNDQRMEYWESIDTSELVGGSIKVKELPILKSFLESLSDQIGYDYLNSTSLKWQKIVADVQSELANTVGRKTDDTRIQPLFFMGLKHYMRQF